MLVLKNNTLTEADLDLHEDDYVARIPHTLNEKSLFTELKEKLLFPSYFGENWNALRDMMRDFEWLPNKKIVVIHEKLPSLSAEDLKIYLDILQEAILIHSERGFQELVVAFPEANKEVLSKYFKIA